MERATGIEPVSKAWEASDRAGTGGPSAKNWILRGADKLASHKPNLVCGDSAIRLVFAEGEIGGTPCMRSHILIHVVTIKFCDNPFTFKNEIEKEGLPRDSTPDLGAGGPEFKSRRPDQNISRVFFSLLKAPFTSNPICGILADRSS